MNAWRTPPNKLSLIGKSDPAVSGSRLRPKPERSLASQGLQPSITEKVTVVAI